MHNKQQNFC